MKRLLFLLPVLFFLKATAQQPYYDFKEFKKNKDGSFLLPLDKNMSIDSLKKLMERTQMLRATQSMGKLIYTQPNGTRVFVLPQDNMICLVPDMSQFNMPVVGKSIKISGMPPGSMAPNNIFPKKE